MTLSPENIMFSSSAIINLIKCNFKDIFVNGIYEEGWNYTHGTILYNEFTSIEIIHGSANFLSNFLIFSVPNMFSCFSIFYLFPIFYNCSILTFSKHKVKC